MKNFGYSLHVLVKLFTNKYNFIKFFDNSLFLRQWLALQYSYFLAQQWQDTFRTKRLMFYLQFLIDGFKFLTPCKILFHKLILLITRDEYF